MLEDHIDRIENSEGGIEPFPHIYGTIDIDAVEDVIGLEWDPTRATFPALDRIDGSNG